MKIGIQCMGHCSWSDMDSKIHTKHTEGNEGKQRKKMLGWKILGRKEGREK